MRTLYYFLYTIGLVLASLALVFIFAFLISKVSAISLRYLLVGVGLFLLLTFGWLIYNSNRNYIGGGGKTKNFLKTQIESENLTSTIILAAISLLLLAAYWFLRY